MLGVNRNTGEIARLCAGLFSRTADAPGFSAHVCRMTSSMTRATIALNWVSVRTDGSPLNRRRCQSSAVPRTCQSHDSPKGPINLEKRSVSCGLTMAGWPLRIACSHVVPDRGAPMSRINFGESIVLERSCRSSARMATCGVCNGSHVSYWSGCIRGGITLNCDR